MSQQQQFNNPYSKCIMLVLLTMLTSLLSLYISTDLSVGKLAIIYPRIAVVHNSNVSDLMLNNHSKILTLGFSANGYSNRSLKDLGLHYMDSNYFEQFKKSTAYRQNKQIAKQQNMGYKKTFSRHEISDMIINFQEPQETYGIVNVHVDIKSKSNSPINGCNFEAKQTFTLVTPRFSLCSSVDHFNGSYSIQCRYPGVACSTLDVVLLYCFFEAFTVQPRFYPWMHHLLTKHICYNITEATQATEGPPHSPKRPLAVSWSIYNKSNDYVRSKMETCNELFLDNSPVFSMSDKEMCACVERQYDNVYLVGTSHIGHFGDYLMMHCAGANMTYVPNAVKHGNYNAGKIHWRDGYYFEMLYPLFKKQLPVWSTPGSRIAIWICTGSWDYSFRGLQYSIETGLNNHMRKALNFLVDHQRKCSNCSLDIRLLTTPPQPKRHHLNSIYIQAFNSQLWNLVVGELGLDMLDMFAIYNPCKEDTAQNGPMRHHYLQRLHDGFDGHVGKIFFWSVFLPHVCPKPTQ